CLAAAAGTPRPVWRLFEWDVLQSPLLHFRDRPLSRLLRVGRTGQTWPVHVSEPTRNLHDLRVLRLETLFFDFVDRLVIDFFARRAKRQCRAHGGKPGSQYMAAHYYSHLH